MRILQINTTCGTGSTGRIAVDIAKIAQEQGHDTLIAYGRNYKETPGIKAIRIGNDFDVYAHVLYTRITDKTGFASTHATRKFIQKIKEYDPDEIHLHNIHGYYINIEVLFNYLKEANKPVVWTLHDCWAFTGHCAYFDHVGCDRWKTGCYGCPQKNSYPASKFLSNAQFNYENKKRLFTLIKNMTIITPSQWLANLVKQSFLDKFPVHIIHNGIDINVFKPTQSNFRAKYRLEDRFIILGVANIWDKRKGLDDFIKLSAMLDENFKIVLVGLNKKQLKTLPENVIGLQRTESPQELAGIYTTIDVFFNPTYEDNFPTVNLEAQACGTPIITYDAGGSAECILNKISGDIVDAGDLRAVNHLIDKICKRGDTRENVQLAAKEFDKFKCFNKYLQVYIDNNKINNK